MIENQPIIVTGASGGIGLALVEDLLRRGYNNLACQYFSNENVLQELFHKFEKPFKTHCFKADLTRQPDVQSLREQVTDTFGTVFGVINLVGSSSNAMSWRMTSDEFDAVMDTNVRTTFLMCKEFIPIMRDNNRGRIINTSSVVGFTGAVGASHYAAAKAAIVGYTKSLALELAPKKITANTLALGYFEYGLINQVSPVLQNGIKAKTPAQRFGTGNEIGGMVHYLLSDDGAFTTGQSMHINGGLHLC